MNGLANMNSVAGAMPAVGSHVSLERKQGFYKILFIKYRRQYNGQLLSVASLQNMLPPYNTENGRLACFSSYNSLSDYQRAYPKAE